MDDVINPLTTALVLIDLQHSVVERELEPHDPHEVVRRCAAMGKALRSKAGTVVFVRVLVAELAQLPVDSPSPQRGTHLPANACELMPEAEVQPGDLILTKRQWGAFYGTDLDQLLRRRGVETIILAGISTNFGVESTGRAAFDRGYELIFVEDAMTSYNSAAHDFAVQQIFARMGRVRLTHEILEALA